MAARDPNQVWWQAADGHWYPPTSHPSHEWSGRPVHVRTGCGGLVGTTMLVVLAVTVLGSGHVGLLLLAIPLLVVFAAVSFMRMIGRSILMMSRISDEAWQEAHRRAQQRFAEQLRFFCTQFENLRDQRCVVPLCLAKFAGALAVSGMQLFAQRTILCILQHRHV